MIARSRWPLVALSVFVVAATVANAAPVPPGQSALAVIPAQSPIVIHIRGVERTKDRLLALIKGAVPDLGIIAAAKIEEALKEGLEDRKLQGLEKDGPIFVAFLEMPNENMNVPVMAIIARVTKFNEFRDGLLSEDERKSIKKNDAGIEQVEMKGHDAFFLERAGWAVVTPHKETATLLTKNNPGLDTKLSVDVAKRLLGSDVSVYVDLAAVNKQFGDQIKEAKDQFFGLMDQFGGQDKATMDMVKGIYGGMFQVVEDGRALMLGLDFRPEGLAFQLAANVGADTATNKFLKDQKPAPLTQIGTLPAGQVTYTATEMSPRMLKSMAPLIFGVVGDAEAQKEVEAALEKLIAAGNTSSISAGSFPAATLQVSMFNDPVKAADAQLKLFRAMGEGTMFQNASIKGKPEIKEKAEEFKGFSLNFAHIEWDLDKLAEQIPGGGDDAKKAIKKLMGEGMDIWFGTDGKRFITVSAKNWSEAKSKIESYLQGSETIGANEAFMATRKQLSPDATMLMLFDSGRMVMTMGEYMLSLFKAVPGLPFNLPENMKPVKTEPAFIGGSIVMKPEFGSFEFFIPVTAVHEIRKVLMPLFFGGE